MKGRCLAVAAAGTLVLAAAACDDKKDDLPTAVRDRSNAVTAAAAQPTAPAAATAAGAKPAPRKRLCTSEPGKSAPKTSPRALAAQGADAPPLPVPFGVGKWVWVNLWAAWCAPCKEEIPRLLAWQKKLAQKGVSIDLAFVSMDDDERQLRRFLDGQPAAGMRASYWLPEGEPRYSFLREIGVSEKVSLPVQALVAPSGDTKCVIEGAVDDGDWPAVAAFVGAKP
ncbi:MAG TPA: TlpA disulfide reductase family protein [Minicystis sp.]|nr:TlpA disulfide reductase family protein [Minicystis sp.]